jgi:hypothetical protein
MNMGILASSYDQSRYLRAEDAKQDRLLRIKGVTEELVGQGSDQEKKLVVWFKNDRRGLPLNRTNNRTLRGAYSDDTSGWPDKLVEVFPTQADFRGRLVGALRLRIPPPRQDSTSAAPQQPIAPQPAAPAAVQPQAVAAAPTPAVAQQPAAAAPAAAASVPAPQPMQSAAADPAAANFDLDDEIPWVP